MIIPSLTRWWRMLFASAPVRNPADCHGEHRAWNSAALIRIAGWLPVARPEMIDAWASDG